MKLTISRAISGETKLILNGQEMTNVLGYQLEENYSMDTWPVLHLHIKVDAIEQEDKN